MDRFAERNQASTCRTFGRLDFNDPQQALGFAETIIFASTSDRRGNSNIAKDAPKHFVGYSCFNDGSLRDYQFKHSLAVGKNFVATGGFGSWILTRDEIPDPSRLTLTTRLNGIQLCAISHFWDPFALRETSRVSPAPPGQRKRTRNNLRLL